MKATGLDELAASQRQAGRSVADEAKKVLKRGAQNIKTDAVARARTIGYLPHIHRAIGYNVYWTGDRGHAEIGFTKEKKQGALGNIIEYGTVNNAPRPVLAPALEAEEPRFMEQLEKLGEELLE